MNQPLTPGDITHGKCGKTWTGLSRAHCPSCCETFSRDSAADKHRVGQFGVDRRCADPSSVGLVPHQQPWGVMWSHPSPANGFDHRSRHDDDFIPPAADGYAVVPSY